MTDKTIMTEQLIASLAKAPLPRPLALGRMMFLVMTMTALGVGVWIALMGTRPDLGHAIIQPAVAAKTVLPAILASLALALTARSARPGRRVPLLVLIAPIPFAMVLFLTAMIATPAPMIAEAIIGSTAVKCLTAVVGLSILPIVVGLFFLKDGASTRPATTGALLGLAAGAGAACGYSLACTEDSPLFYVVWYGLAICAAGGIGAVVGKRYLKW
jgi:hypothetical protein